MSRRRHDRWLLIRLAAQNVGRRRLRAIFLGVAVMLGVGIGFASFVAGWALRDGMARSFSRMGADLLVVPRALEKPPAAPPKSLMLGGKSLCAALNRPNSTRQRGAACTNTGSMNAASIIADVHRPLATSHARTPSASAASARSAHRPELMIARGSALRIQPPILTADTNKESASVAYATTVKSMAHHPLGPSCIRAAALVSRPQRSASRRIFSRRMPAEVGFVYSLTAPVIAET